MNLSCSSRNAIFQQDIKREPQYTIRGTGDEIHTGNIEATWQDIMLIEST
jgi:hypothetical protein